MNDVCAKRTQARREHSYAMAIGSRLACMRSYRAGFRAHHRDAHLRSKLYDSIKPARKLVGRGQHLASAFGQMFITDPVRFKSFSKRSPVVLRPARARHASHVTHESDLVTTEQFEEVVERVATVTDSANCDLV